MTRHRGLSGPAATAAARAAILWHCAADSTLALFDSWFGGMYTRSAVGTSRFGRGPIG